MDLANDLLDKGFIIMSSTPCDGKWNTGYAISQLGLDAIESRSKERLLGVLEGYMQRNNQQGHGSSAPLMECRRNDQHG